MTRTVLVVEDDLGMQEAIEGTLELEGYRVLLARDGIDGLQMLERGLPDLIVLDLMLPRMDGYAFNRELQQRGFRPRIPVLLLTADGRAQQKAEQLQAEGYLAKPFDVDDLLTEVERLLNG